MALCYDNDNNIFEYYQIMSRDFDKAQHEAVRKYMLRILMRNYFGAADIAGMSNDEIIERTEKAEKDAFFRAVTNVYYAAPSI